MREWAAAPARALAARGGALGVRAFVSGSGRLWLDGSNAPQAWSGLGLGLANPEPEPEPEPEP